eukprot:Lankesteria_metandrocarpae@DN5399_c0_g1_i7.p1
MDDVSDCLCAVSPNAIPMSLIVNGVKASAMADTGSYCSLVNDDDALKMQLVKTAITKQFKGLGECSGNRAEPVDIEFADGSKCSVIFYIVSSKLPIVIGLEALNAMDAVVYCRQGIIVRNGATISLPVEDRIWQIEKSHNGSDIKNKEDKKSLESRLSEVNCGLSEYRNKLLNLLKENTDCWLTPKVGQCRIVERSFKVEGKPVKSPVMPLSDDKRAELKKQIDGMLRKGVIVPSKSPWAAAAFFVPKKTGDWRMVLDYRPVNKRMVNDSYPYSLHILRITQCML